MVGSVQEQPQLGCFCWTSSKRPEEAWFFKQYDTRPGVPRCTFHSSFIDPFHEKDPDCPERKSAEFRILLTFPKKKEPLAAKL
jgi:hypothetical protein